MVVPRYDGQSLTNLLPWQWKQCKAGELVRLVVPTADVLASLAAPTNCLFVGHPATNTLYSIFLVQSSELLRLLSHLCRYQQGEAPGATEWLSLSVAADGDARQQQSITLLLAGRVCLTAAEAQTLHAARDEGIVLTLTRADESRAAVHQPFVAQELPPLLRDGPSGLTPRLARPPSLSVTRDLAVSVLTDVLQVIPSLFVEPTAGTSEADTAASVECMLSPHQWSFVNWALDRESERWTVSALRSRSNRPVAKHSLSSCPAGGGPTRPLDRPAWGGGILADDMGMGKTASVLGLVLVSLRRAERAGTLGAPCACSGHTIVVVPTACVSVWLQQARLHTPSLHVVRYAGPAMSPLAMSQAHIVVATYPQVLAASRREVRERGQPSHDYGLMRRRWRRLVLDEAHVLRSPTATTSRAVHALASNAESTWALSGTMVQNSLDDFGAIFDVIGPVFRERWGKLLGPLVRGMVTSNRARGSSSSTADLPRVSTVDPATYKDDRHEAIPAELRGPAEAARASGSDSEARDALRSLVPLLLAELRRVFVLRRTASDSGKGDRPHIPPLSVHYVTVPLSRVEMDTVSLSIMAAQSLLVRQAERAVRERAARRAGATPRRFFDVDATHAFQLLGKARAGCCDARLAGPLPTWLTAQADEEAASEAVDVESSPSFARLSLARLRDTSKDDVDCPICLESGADVECVLAMPCGHFMCSWCFDSAVATEGGRPRRTTTADATTRTTDARYRQVLDAAFAAEGMTTTTTAAAAASSSSSSSSSGAPHDDGEYYEGLCPICRATVPVDSEIVVGQGAVGVADEAPLVSDEVRRAELPAVSSKAAAILRIVRAALQSGTHKQALVFCTSSRFLRLLQPLFQPGEAAILDGRVVGAERDRLVDHFAGPCRAGGPRVLLVSLRVAAVGISLVGASLVLFADQWWNPSLQQQAVARAHRMGQHRPVVAMHLLAESTIECAMVSLHQHKEDLAKVSQGQLSLSRVLPREVLQRLAGLNHPPPPGSIDVAEAVRVACHCSTL